MEMSSLSKMSEKGLILLINTKKNVNKSCFYDVSGLNNEAFIALFFLCIWVFDPLEALKMNKHISPNDSSTH